MDRNITILVVDDDNTIGQLLVSILSSTYKQVDLARDADEALKFLSISQYNLALVDIRLPKIDGIWLLKEIKQRYEDTEVVMITGVGNLETAVECMRLGAANYFTKPIRKNQLDMVIERALERRDLLLTKRNYQKQLETCIEKKTQELRRVIKELEEFNEDIIYRLANAVESRDHITGKHLGRMSKYTELLAEVLGLNYKLIGLASLLHDVGKIGIPDNILLKESPLTDDEYEIIKTHPVIGGKILSGGTGLTLQTAKIIAEQHHERWDGTGYPMGLSGEAISLEGRIVAITDSFDAISSTRPYRPAMTFEKSLEILTEESGTHFDPSLIDIFIKSKIKVKRIYDNYIS